MCRHVSSGCLCVDRFKKNRPRETLSREGLADLNFCHFFFSRKKKIGSKKPFFFFFGLAIFFFLWLCRWTIEATFFYKKNSSDPTFFGQKKKTGKSRDPQDPQLVLEGQGNSGVQEWRIFI